MIEQLRRRVASLDGKLAVQQSQPVVGEWSYPRLQVFSGNCVVS